MCAPTPLSFSIQLDEARSELKDDILRGHGGRAALAARAASVCPFVARVSTYA